MTAARGGNHGLGLAQALAVAALEHDEDDAVQDEHRGHDDLVVEVLVYPIIEREAEDRGGNATDHDHPPQPPRALLLGRALARREGVELVEVQDEHGEDGADLDHHEEQGEELFRYLQLDELVDEDHVAGRRDGKPFGDALDDADEEGLERFDNHTFEYLLLFAGIVLQR